MKTPMIKTQRDIRDFLAPKIRKSIQVMEKPVPQIIVGPKSDEHKDILEFLKTSYSQERMNKLINLHHNQKPVPVTSTDWEYVFAFTIKEVAGKIELALGDHTPGVDLKTKNLKKISLKKL